MRSCSCWQSPGARRPSQGRGEREALLRELGNAAPRRVEGVAQRVVESGACFHRYRKRGLSDAGDAANEVEVEFVCTAALPSRGRSDRDSRSASGREGCGRPVFAVASHVSVRGSAPLLWCQDTAMLPAKPKIRRRQVRRRIDGWEFFVVGLLPQASRAVVLRCRQTCTSARRGGTWRVSCSGTERLCFY